MARTGLRISAFESNCWWVVLWLGLGVFQGNIHLIANSAAGLGIACLFDVCFEVSTQLIKVGPPGRTKELEFSIAALEA